LVPPTEALGTKIEGLLLLTGSISFPPLEANDIDISLEILFSLMKAGGTLFISYYLPP